MANKKISALTAATTVDGSELVEVVQDGGNKKMTTSLLRSYEETFANLSGTTWDTAAGRVKSKTISADTTITLSNLVAGKSKGLLSIIQSGGPHTLNMKVSGDAGAGSVIPLNDDSPTLVWFVDAGGGVVHMGSNAGSVEPVEPAAWEDLLFPTQVGLTESPSKNFVGGNAAFGSYGLSATLLTGTAAIRCKTGTPGSDTDAMMGLKLSASNGDYTTWKWGFYLSNESGHLRVQHIDNGTPTSVAGSVYGVGYINYGDYAALFRDVATGVVYLKTSADGTTWTTSWTFAETSTADMDILINPYNSKSVYLPQIINDAI